jgi:hypothetical protein
MAGSCERADTNAKRCAPRTIAQDLPHLLHVSIQRLWRIGCGREEWRRQQGDDEFSDHDGKAPPGAACYVCPIVLRRGMSAMASAEFWDALFGYSAAAGLFIAMMLMLGAEPDEDSDSSQP